MSSETEKKEKRMDSLRLYQHYFFFIIIIGIYVGMFFVPIFGIYDGEGKGYIVEHAWENTRDITAVKWHVIPLLVVVLYFYFQHWEKEKYDKILAAAAFFLMDWFNETYNSFFYHVGGFSPLWTCNRKEASFMIMIGWNIEIIFNFLMCGLMCTMLLPKEKNKVYLGYINNRQFWAFFGSFLSVSVEIFLNKADMLIWNYWWWNTYFPFLIYLNGYVVFYEIAYYVYDSPRYKQIGIVAFMFLFNCIFTGYGWWIGYV